MVPTVAVAFVVDAVHAVHAWLELLRVRKGCSSSSSRSAPNAEALTSAAHGASGDCIAGAGADRGAPRVAGRCLRAGRAGGPARRACTSAMGTMCGVCGGKDLLRMRLEIAGVEDRTAPCAAPLEIL